MKIGDVPVLAEPPREAKTSGRERFKTLVKADTLDASPSTHCRSSTAVDPILAVVRCCTSKSFIIQMSPSKDVRKILVMLIPPGNHTDFMKCGVS